MPRAKPGARTLAARATALQFLADNLAEPPKREFDSHWNEEQSRTLEVARRRLRAQAERLWSESGRLTLGLPKR
ncbi:hypothetical protein AB4Y45_32800 [Paraburkholderia sp. EG287A]|uniref:hypothetical protein n=1 Tax=Paraburkholderia sp. EG287A TaxID=3237012 RepID=UPI0034D213C7